MKPIYVLLLLFAGSSLATQAQKLSQEGTHEISKKANKGYLYEPTVDEAKNEVVMTYVTKASGRKAKFETYKFDLEFNFKGMEESEVPLEKIKGFKADKGEEYSVEAVTVEPNLLGTLILKSKTYKRKWNWFWGGYDTKVSFGEKIKPKSDDGGKFQYIAHSEQQESGNILIFAGDKGTGLGNALKMTTEIHILRFDHDLNKISDNLLKFDYPQTVVAVNTDDQDDDNDTDNDVLLLFAPMGGKAYKKSADPVATNYTFVRVGKDGTVKERVSVASKAGIFNGNMFVTIGDDVLIMGATGEKTDDYFDEKFAAPVNMRDDEVEKFKAKGFQVVKISKGKTEFVSNNTLEDFDKKSQSPPSQKKNPEYTGRKFKVADIKLLSNGDILLAGQKYTKAKGGGHVMKFGNLGSLGGGSGGGAEYEDIIMMHFGGNGVLKASYGVRREENDKDAKSSPNNQLIMESKDGKSVYWTIMEMKGWRQEKELGESKYKFLMYPNVTKIDVANAKIGDFVQMGQGKSDYYVNNKYPSLPIGKGQIVFLGENKSGKTLWFAKMPLE
ncbi:hypothetical protein WG954_01885 [Lacibacter sp. H375]|uniref:hypothetical protein n=1 Tax=Lacibacter sp. H375 TaxID=3133424 RepID=UPI0030C29A4E